MRGSRLTSYVQNSGLAIPEPYSDVAVSTLCYVAVTEELARGWMTIARAMGGHTVVAKLVARFGSEEQKRNHPPQMATGELRATMGTHRTGRRRRNLTPVRDATLRREWASSSHPKHVCKSVWTRCGSMAVTAMPPKFPIESYFRDAPLMIVGEGTNEIQHNVIAKQLVWRGGLHSSTRRNLLARPRRKT